MKYNDSEKIVSFRLKSNGVFIKLFNIFISCIFKIQEAAPKKSLVKLPNKAKVIKKTDGEIYNVMILNDTSSEAFHLGCNVVMNNLAHLCCMYNLKIIKSLTDRSEFFDIEDFKKQLSEIDAVIVNGEGTLHHNRGQGIYKRVKIAKECGKKVFLINTVWQENFFTKKYLKLFDLISVRESISFDNIINDGAENAFVTPDLTFYSKKSFKLLKKPAKSFDKNNSVVFIDNTLLDKTEELKLESITRNSDFLYMTKNKNHVTSFEQLLAYERIVSGRFHGLCIAMILEIPTLIYVSNTIKVEGLVKDANLEDYLFNNNIDDFLEKPRDEFVVKAKQYIELAEPQIEELFKRIRSAIP